VNRGKCNKEIAAAVGITTRTVKFHVSSLLAMFAVESRRDLGSFGATVH
jgi:DNA-binding NarL/FixJ family response regulator